MKNKLNEELKDIKYLFNYNRGRVISEQDKFDDQEEFVNYDDINYEDELSSFDLNGMFKGMSKSNGDMDIRTPEEREMDRRDIDMELEEEEEDFNYLKDETFENREIETPVRPGIKTPTKPKKPGTPYSPKPGPKKNPKARKGDMPTWLSFDELGINLK
jgi:hypothetical protein